MRAYRARLATERADGTTSHMHTELVEQIAELTDQRDRLTTRVARLESSNTVLAAQLQQATTGTGTGSISVVGRAASGGQLPMSRTQRRQAARQTKRRQQS